MEKKFNKDAIKDMLYGTINEITNNNSFYYRGISDNYDHITDQGKEQLLLALSRIIPLINHAEDEAIAERAKGMTLDLLKDHKK